jgi:hypothetical protein
MLRERREQEVEHAKGKAMRWRERIDIYMGEFKLKLWLMRYLTGV